MYGDELITPSFLLTDTSLWLKGDNPNNTDIRWYDSSPNDYILNGTATLTDNVLNSQKGYVFNGSSDFFNGGDILDHRRSDKTIYVIANFTKDGAVIAKSSIMGIDNRWGLGKFGNIASAYHDDTSTPTISTTISLNTFHKIKEVVGRNKTTPNHTFTLDGNTPISKTVISANNWDMNSNLPLLIGAYGDFSSTPLPPYSLWYHGGSICEIIILDRLLTTDESIEMDIYLNTKYGL